MGDANMQASAVYSVRFGDLTIQQDWQTRYLDDGVLDVREVFSPPEVLELLEISNFIFSSTGYVGSLQDRQDDASQRLANLYKTWGLAFLNSLLSDLQSAMPAAATRLTALGARLTELARQIAASGGTARALEQHSVFKKIEASSLGTMKLVWHRDADAAGTITASPDAVNIWIPLCNAGIYTPSLQVVRGSHRYMRATPTKIQSGGYEAIEDEWVNATFSTNTIAAPVLNIGDVLIFDHHLLHRTQPMDNAVLDRSSMEFRVAYERLNPSAAVDVGSGCRDSGTQKAQARASSFVGQFVAKAGRIWSKL